MKYIKPAQGLLLSLSVVLIWCWIYGRTSWAAWSVPVGYGGDGWLGLGFAKAFLDGDIYPILFKSVSHLGAPFAANWNDYPLTEELVFALMGWIGRFTGLFPAANIVTLLGHLFAAISFWLVGRELKYRSEFIFAGAILFAFSHYIFARGFDHIVLSYYWHLPLILMVTWWSYSNQRTKLGGRKLYISIATAIATGILNPYYTWMFLQFLGFAVLLHAAKKQYRSITLPFILILISCATFFAMNADSIGYSLLQGKNPEAVSRSLAGLEVYGLKLPELIFPPAYHAWKAWADYGQTHYFLPSLIKGEMGSPYLGLMGLVGFVWLFGIALYRILIGRAQRIPVHAWQVLWILLFSLIGGINLLLGTFGIILFRGSNRYSIVILTIVLLFLVRQLSRKCPDRLVLPVAILMAAVGLWDQLPPRVNAAQIKEVARVVQSDREFSHSLEANLGKEAMVFQLPVAPFPEIPPIVQMGDYEHFRPYLFTKNLRYSYGTNKGRGDADWQADVSRLNAVEMVTSLEEYGFSTILINKKGYEDSGARLMAELAALKKEVLAEKGDLIAFRLNPKEVRTHPQNRPKFGAGWSADEGTHRWAISNQAEIKFSNHAHNAVSANIEFTFMTLKPRNVDVMLNGTLLGKIAMNQGGMPFQATFPLVTLRAGVNTFVMKTDVPPESPGNGDSRKLSFGLSNIKMHISD